MAMVSPMLSGALPLALAIGLSVLVSGCSTTGTGTDSSFATAPSPDGTNAPVAGGVQVVPGSEEDFMVNVGRRTFFTENSSALDDTARTTLDLQAAWLNRYPQWKVKLQGFSDDPGSAQANTALSQKRADAVRNYLISRGIAPDRMLAKGYGRDRLVQDCPELHCKAQNRRVVTNPSTEDPT